MESKNLGKFFVSSRREKFSAGCPIPCNFPPGSAYTGREAKCKGGNEMNDPKMIGIGDVDDLIFQDSWTTSQR